MSLTRETAEAWLKLTLEKLQENIRKKKIGYSGNLSATLHGFVRAQAGGQVQLIQIFYNYYGSMVELGVGRGMGMSGASEERKIAKLVGSKPRKAKAWKRKEISYQTLRLRELAEEQAMKSITENARIDSSLLTGINIQF